MDPTRGNPSQFHQSGDLAYLTFPVFEEHGLIHGVFARTGGVSPAPWASLNLSTSVGDSLENVRENRRRALAALGVDFTSAYDTWLVHGTDVVFADAPKSLDAPPVKADILLTDRPDVTISMRFADCTPILLYDPVHRVIGFAHGGWQGTIRRVAAVAVQAMQEHYHSNPADICAIIGPAICVQHYPVGQEVSDHAQAAFGDAAAELFEPGNGQVHFDLWKANRFVLERAGVRHVEVSGVCTACDTEHWFSHRAEHGRTGRFAAYMALP
jgi:polyphenol oxidase